MSQSGCCCIFACDQGPHCAYRRSIKRLRHASAETLSPRALLISPPSFFFSSLFEVTRHRHKRAAASFVDTLTSRRLPSPLWQPTITLVPFQCRDSKGIREYFPVSYYDARSTVPTIDLCDGRHITAIEQSKDKCSFRDLARKRA